MPISPTIESGPSTPETRPTPTGCGTSVLIALFGPGPLAEFFAGHRIDAATQLNSAGSADLCEPRLAGLYLDRDGDVWQRSEAGWRLRRQRGAAVEDPSLWEWMDGHVRDYAPFVLITME
ncbi:hypothetical protein [Nocardia goodfellowii]|uniref:Uncharacterized protein n=1 Tax=Nocardia goodfellowii TaxID=882446 RepID=A0ABS4QNC7_9NOCA|nr:hypothetical protein [Nocardia goodfellowii]MBP2193048.1 hypothetical protein [Nocardia goodfellowii]